MTILIGPYRLQSDPRGFRLLDRRHAQNAPANGFVVSDRGLGIHMATEACLLEYERRQAAQQQQHTKKRRQKHVD